MKQEGKKTDPVTFDLYALTLTLADGTWVLNETHRLGMLNNCMQLFENLMNRLEVMKQKGNQIQ